MIIVEDLKSQLRFLKEIEIKETLEEAREQASKLIADARARAEQIRTKEIEEILQKARDAEMREMESARLRGKRALADTKFRLIETALAKAFDRLKGQIERQDPLYRRGLEELIVEAVEKIAASELEIAVSHGDLAFVKQRLGHIEKRISTAKGVSVSLKLDDEPLRSAGGVVVRSTDGKQIFNNTLEARLARVQEEMVIKISEILFEGTGP